MTCELNTRKPSVTDRALRYRAHQCPPDGPRRCAECGSTRFLVIDHKDGREENTARSNLRWLCKSCNTRLGAEMAKQGKGRRTEQYNATGARTLGEYSEALASHRRGAHDAGGAVIHATSPDKRAQFASEIWKRRKERYGAAGRANPAADEVFEEFHGYPSEEDLVFEIDTVEHGRLAALGELRELTVKPVNGGGRARLAEFDGAVLATDGAKRQLYIVGGDQSVDLAEFGIDPETAHDRELLGELVRVVYHTDKSHLGDQGGDADYHHEFGEETGQRGALIYNTLSQTLEIAGGGYSIEAAGVRD